jgi:hypothetical protein
MQANEFETAFVFIVASIVLKGRRFHHISQS